MLTWMNRIKFSSGTNTVLIQFLIWIWIMTINICNFIFPPKYWVPHGLTFFRIRITWTLLNIITVIPIILAEFSSCCWKLKTKSFCTESAKWDENTILFYISSKIWAFERVTAQRFLSSKVDFQDGGRRRIQGLWTFSWSDRSRNFQQQVFGE